MQTPPLHHNFLCFVSKSSRSSSKNRFIIRSNSVIRELNWLENVLIEHIEVGY